MSSSHPFTPLDEGALDMVASPPPHRITGPLRTWYDMHEALGHEVTSLAEMSATVTAGELDAFARRFRYFDQELRSHSEVEDGIMFPAGA